MAKVDDVLDEAAMQSGACRGDLRGADVPADTGCDRRHNTGRADGVDVVLIDLAEVTVMDWRRVLHHRCPASARTDCRLSACHLRSRD